MLKYFLGFSLSFFYFSMAEANETCAKKLEIIQPISKEKIKNFIEWEEAHSDDLPADLTPPSGGGEGQDVYVLDINNDGIDEYVVAKELGTGHVLVTFVFSKQGDGNYTYLTMPALKSIHSGQEDPTSGWYYNPLDKKQEAFAKLCNKNYMLFNNIYFPAARHVLIWEKSNVDYACTADWMVVHRNYFKTLYDKSEYVNAHNYFQGLLKDCANQMSKKDILWLKNDLALVATKNNDPQTCLLHIQEIKSDPDFHTTSSKALKDAVQFNEKQCSKQLKLESVGNTGKYDYSWLLNNKFKDHYDFRNRQDEIFSAVVPSVKNKQWKKPDGLRQEFREIFFNGAGFAAQKNFTIKEDRFIIFIAQMFYDPIHAIVWIDAKNSISAMAMTKPVYTTQEGNEIYPPEIHLILGSRSISKDDLPKDFVNATKLWMKEEKISIKDAVFYDYTGNSKNVTEILAIGQ